MQQVKIIAFDADDTLWVNEPYFQETEQRFCALLEDYLPRHSISQELYKTEVQNLARYGYGIKGFTLSMIETLLRIVGDRLTAAMVQECIALGQVMLDRDIELLDGVVEVLESLKGKYRLVVATKGDLLDQERKLMKSGIQHHFHHIEIMSDKREADYLKLLKRLDCRPEEFLMIGNSLKSDVLPVLAIGGHAVHVPYHTTWHHEVAEAPAAHERMKHLDRISLILDHLNDETAH